MSKFDTAWHRDPLSIGKATRPDPSPTSDGSWWVDVAKRSRVEWAERVAAKQVSLQCSPMGKQVSLILHGKADPASEARWRLARKRAIEAAKERAK